MSALGSQKNGGQVLMTDIDALFNTNRKGRTVRLFRHYEDREDKTFSAPYYAGYQGGQERNSHRPERRPGPIFHGGSVRCRIRPFKRPYAGHSNISRLLPADRPARALLHA